MVGEEPRSIAGDCRAWQLFLAACLLIVSAPHTHAAKTVRYNGFQLAEGAMSVGLLPEYKEEAEARLGVDFRLILTPASKETTEEMKRVAEACLPKQKYKNFVMPSVGGAMHQAYGDSTDYLLCAKTQERQRFCESHERKRLAEQLVQYRDRRQNVLGQERFIEKSMKTEAVQYQVKRFKETSESISDKPAAPTMTRSIGAEFDARIAAKVTDLVQAGYLSGADFGWMGLYLPEEYVPYLGVDQTSRGCV